MSISYRFLFASYQNPDSDGLNFECFKSIKLNWKIRDLKLAFILKLLFKKIEIAKAQLTPADMWAFTSSFEISPFLKTLSLTMVALDDKLMLIFVRWLLYFFMLVPYDDDKIDIHSRSEQVSSHSIMSHAFGTCGLKAPLQRRQDLG